MNRIKRLFTKKERPKKRRSWRNKEAKQLTEQLAALHAALGECMVVLHLNNSKLRICKAVSSHDIEAPELDDDDIAPGSAGDFPDQDHTLKPKPPTAQKPDLNYFG